MQTLCRQQVHVELVQDRPDCSYRAPPLKIVHARQRVTLHRTPGTSACVSSGCPGWPAPIRGCDRVRVPAKVLMQAASRATSTPPASAQASRYGRPARSPRRLHQFGTVNGLGRVAAPRRAATSTSDPPVLVGDHRSSSLVCSLNASNYRQVLGRSCGHHTSLRRIVQAYPSPRFISTRCRPALPRAFHSDNCRCRSSAVKVSRRLSRSSL